MKQFSKLRLCGAALICAVAASCTEIDTVTRAGTGLFDGFQSDYVQAREALIAGELSTARTRYERLLRVDSPASPRLRLEYAHALLRDDAFEQASAQANLVAAQSDGAMKAGAMAVVATAEHELALRLTDAVATKPHLQKAQAAIAVALTHADVTDPNGQLVRRLSQINAKL